jgi:hypothetical protein
MPRAQGKRAAVSTVAIQRNNTQVHRFDTGRVTAHTPTGRSDQLGDLCTSHKLSTIELTSLQPETQSIALHSRWQHTRCCDW